MKSLFFDDNVGRVILDETICTFPWKLSVEELSMVMDREFRLRKFYEWELAVYGLPYSKNKDCFGIVGKIC